MNQQPPPDSFKGKGINLKVLFDNCKLFQRTKPAPININLKALREIRLPRKKKKALKKIEAKKRAARQYPESTEDCFDKPPIYTATSNDYLK